MKTIPIQFKHKGVDYIGELRKVSGAASAGCYHLMVNNFYCGQLNYTRKWNYTGNRFEDIAEVIELELAIKIENTSIGISYD